MKRIGILFCFLCLCGVAGAALMSVQVRTSHVRSSPSFLGSVIDEIEYGQQVNVVGQQGSWRKVSSAGQTGWVHQSALTKKRIVFQSGERDVETRTSGEELALAGKGFNSDVEAEFKERNEDIDFTWVDKMEKSRVSPGEVKAFLGAGNVSARGGGR